VLKNMRVEGSDETIKQALTQADSMILRTLLYQLEGDKSGIELPTIEVPVFGGAITAKVVDPQYDQVLRDKAFQMLKKWRDEKRSVPPAPAHEKILELMEIAGGVKLTPEEAQVGLEELALVQYPRAVKLDSKVSPEAVKNFHVLVIGSGVGGIASGVYLKQAGIPFTIVTKDGGVGGTWYRNTYPDARVDVASHHYSFSFETPYPWKHYYAPQPEIVEYMEFTAKKHGVMEHIRFHTEVVAMTWNEAKSVWDVKLHKSDGTEEVQQYNAVISSVGLFNETSWPDWEGIESFKGKMFHTSEWDHSYDYDGKRVGIVGTGPSNMQLAPKIAKTAEHLTVFQRTPGWIIPMPDYRSPISKEHRWLMDYMPYYDNWHRFRHFAANMNASEEAMTIDPRWNKPGSASRGNEKMREHFASYAKEKLLAKPELVNKLVPNYPPMAKRPIMDNGWYDAMLRPNVELVTEGVKKITPKGIVTEDGKEHEFDLIVIGVGFATNKFLFPIEIKGRGGVVLEDVWKKDGARAYLGMTIPKFPNLFCLYGPNTNPRGGGIFLWEEIQSRYAILCIKELIESGKHSIDVKQTIHDDYNERMDDAMQNMLWMDKSQKSYYRNEFGRADTNMPWLPKQMFMWTLKPNFKEFEIK
jgi:4-hydroxyacetophenone monooxygenase